MIGALIGDIIGSRHEFAPIKSREFDLFSSDSNFTDDSVCTFAVATGMSDHLDPINTLRKYCRLFPMRGYGGNFQQWIDSISRVGYNSYGNGAVMRISPVALFAKDLEEAELLAIRWTEITHNHPDAIAAAVTFSRILIRLRDGEGKDAILEEASLINLAIKSVEEYHNIGGYHINSLDTLARAIASVIESTSFESSIRNVIYIGSDDDTTAAVAGPMSEFLFGIPEKIVMDSLKIFMVKHAGLPKAMAEMYKNTAKWKLSEEAWKMHCSWIHQVVNFKPIDYCKPGGNDIFGIDAIAIGAGFQRISFVKQSLLQLAKPSKNVAVISIRDEARWQTTLEGWGACLNVNFYDVDDSGNTKFLAKILSNLHFSEKNMNIIARWYSGKYWPWRPIFKCDAEKIAAFIVKANEDGIKEVVIACDYGRSRSVAIAVAIFEVFGAFNFERPLHQYNERVYKLVSIALKV